MQPRWESDTQMLIDLPAKAVALAGCATFLALLACLVPFYAGSLLAITLFLATALIFASVSVACRPSFFVLTFTAFLAAGFVAKAVAHLTFGQPLIEPIGSFGGQWDQALYFAAAGFAGAAVGGFVCGQFPSFKLLRRQVVRPGRVWIIYGAFGMLLPVAIAIYAANYQFNILRIGFPLGIDLDPRLYAALAFIITWGALLAGLTTTQWLAETREWPLHTLILVASLFGLLASLTMASRIQFLLYILASVWVIMWRWRDVRNWRAVAVSMLVAVALFAASLVIVSIERFASYSQAPSTREEQVDIGPVGRILTPEEVKAAHVSGVVGQVKSLIIMRWVGLEGVMTAAGERTRLGPDLLVQGLLEDPAAGTDGLYQRMAGDFYKDVGYFTFLTIPGPIGIASYSGSYFIIAAFMFGLVIAGHSVELACAALTRNMAAASVAGVSLAYLTVQMAFPRTLAFYTIELLLAAGALRVFRLLVMLPVEKRSRTVACPDRRGPC